jgi:uncharacterized protein (TIGR02246 family)
MTLERTQRSEEAAVRAVIAELVQAVRAGDAEAMLAHCAPEIVIYDMLGPLQHAGEEAVREVWEQTLAPFVPPLEHELAELEVAVSGDVAFTRCLSRFGGARKDGLTQVHWVRLTLGLRKRGGRWLAVHQHVSVPFDMEDGTALMDLEPEG